jgi:hypothetical protein
MILGTSKSLVSVSSGMKYGSSGSAGCGAVVIEVSLEW